MNLLVLGAGGMLGHTLLRRLSKQFATWGTVRSAQVPATLSKILGDVRVITGVDASNPESLEAAFEKVRPDVVINCIGIVKQLKEAHDPILSIEINSLLPHRLARMCAARGSRLIHFSTDCVFSGRDGHYTEKSISDAEDLYGRSKFLGETVTPGALTIRSSIIGHEVSTKVGLVEWFLSQKGGRVKGFDKAIYSGLTTGAMADVVQYILRNAPEIDGVWQVSSEAITKYDLLGIINRIYGVQIAIDRDTDFACDRSLDSARFRAKLDWTPPSWQAMIEDMYTSSKLYEGVGNA